MFGSQESINFRLSCIRLTFQFSESLIWIPMNHYGIVHGKPCLKLSGKSNKPTSIQNVENWGIWVWFLSECSRWWNSFLLSILCHRPSNLFENCLHILIVAIGHSGFRHRIHYTTHVVALKHTKFNIHFDLCVFGLTLSKNNKHFS